MKLHNHKIGYTARAISRACCHVLSQRSLAEQILVTLITPLLVPLQMMKGGTVVDAMQTVCP